MGETFKLNRGRLKRALVDTGEEEVCCLTPASTADDLERLLRHLQDSRILECPPSIRITSHPFAVDQADTIVLAVQATEYPAAQVIVGTVSFSELADRRLRGQAPHLDFTNAVAGSVMDLANAALPSLRTLEAYHRGVGRSSGSGSGTVVSMLVIATVTDPAELRRYACSRYAACWFDSDWQPTDLSEAAIEALVISNENPSPSDIGLEILEFDAGMVSPLGVDRGPLKADASGKAR